jgi:hypothetical protein
MESAPIWVCLGFRAHTQRNNPGVLLDPASGRPRVTGRVIELIFSTIATTSVDDDTDLRYDE